MTNTALVQVWAWFLPHWAGIGSWVTDKLLAPALVAVVFAGLTNLWMERRKAERDLVTKICDALKADVSTLALLAGDYWSRKRKAKDTLVEAQIVALQDEVLNVRSLLSSDFNVDLGDDEFFGDLIDAVTGGGFNGSARDPDPERLRAAATLLGQLKGRIVQERWRRLKSTGW